MKATLFLLLLSIGPKPNWLFLHLPETDLKTCFAEHDEVAFLWLAGHPEYELVTWSCEAR
jgi:hypothetical protein